MSLNKKLIDMLCCPVCKGDLTEDSEGKFLICKKCKVKYPIKDGIPVLLVEERVEIKEDEL